MATSLSTPAILQKVPSRRKSDVRNHARRLCAFHVTFWKSPGRQTGGLSPWRCDSVKISTPDCGDADRMLELRRQRAVAGHRGPAVAKDLHMRLARMIHVGVANETQWFALSVQPAPKTAGRG